MAENNALSASPWGQAETNSDNPWAQTSAQPSPQTGSNTQPADEAGNTGNAWGAANDAGSGQMSNEGSDWLNQASDMSQNVQADFSLADPFARELIPFGNWVETGLEWLVTNFRDFFQLIRVPVDVTLGSMENFLLSLSPWLVILFFSLLAWQIAGRRLGISTFISFLLIGFIGAWDQAMVTLSLVFTSVLFSLILGLPMGIWMGKSDRVQNVVRPILDAMQTTPAFVYLVPIVMLFGIGNVPGVVVTIIFALPPLVRLTSLGIRQVPQDLVEASRSFGASTAQMLFKVELPVALPTIMAGVNQNLMLSLSMVVIASMIAVGGLGQMVLRGIGRLDMGLAAVGGLAIVLLAIVLDRLTQSMAQKREQTGDNRWYQYEPLGWVLKIFNKK